MKNSALLAFKVIFMLVGTMACAASLWVGSTQEITQIQLSGFTSGLALIISGMYLRRIARFVETNQS